MNNFNPNQPNPQQGYAPQYQQPAQKPKKSFLDNMSAEDKKKYIFMAGAVGLNTIIYLIFVGLSSLIYDNLYGVAYYFLITFVNLILNLAPIAVGLAAGYFLKKEIPYAIKFAGVFFLGKSLAVAIRGVLSNLVYLVISIFGTYLSTGARGVVSFITGTICLLLSIVACVAILMVMEGKFKFKKKVAKSAAQPQNYAPYGAAQAPAQFDGAYAQGFEMPRQ